MTLKLAFRFLLKIHKIAKLNFIPSMKRHFLSEKSLPCHVSPYRFQISLNTTSTTFIPVSREAVLPFALVEHESITTYKVHRLTSQNSETFLEESRSNH